MVLKVFLTYDSLILSFNTTAREIKGFIDLFEQEKGFYGEDQEAVSQGKSCYHFKGC